MEKNTYLKAAARMLNKRDFFTEFKDGDFLTISADENSSPFAFLHVNNEFEGILIGLSVDFHDTILTADLVIDLFHIAPMAIADEFYFSKSGKCLFGDEALYQYQLECDSEFMAMLVPESTQSH